MQIDRTLLAILGLLSRDAARKRKQIAADLGISEGSLSKKIGSLIAGRYIKRFTIEIDYQKLGYTANAISLIRLDHQSTEKIDEIMGALKRSRSVVEFSTLFGGTQDIYVRWMSMTNADLMGSVSELLKLGGFQVDTLNFGDTHFRQAHLFDIVVPNE